MQKTTSLNDHYTDYLAGLLKKNEFEVLLFQSIQKEVPSMNLPGLEEGDYDDYISWLYPRISKAVKSYRETGSSFEAYIGSIVRKAAKEYRSRQVRNYIVESVAWNSSVTDMFVSENEPGYEYGSEDNMVAEMVKNPRQLLILVLKCCNYVSVDFLERISSRLGMNPEELNDMIDLIKESRIRRTKRMDMMREKIYCQFCRNMVYEKTIPSLMNEIAIQRMKDRLERGRNRLAKMRERLALMHSDPSNAEIAQLMGISKGTVDSAMHFLKAQWNKSGNKNILN